MHERLDGDRYQVMAETILGSYPAANLGDPVIYVRALRELLMSYPAKVAMAIASPRNGIVTRCKFPPSMAEVAEMAAPMVAEMQREIDRHDEGRKQIEYRSSSDSTPEERAEAIAKWEQVKAGMLLNMKASRKVSGKPLFRQYDAIRGTRKEPAQ